MVTECLLKAGIDPHWTSPKGHTYLHLAALHPGEEWSTHVALVELLLGWGAPLGEAQQPKAIQRAIEGIPLSRSEEARGKALLAIGRPVHTHSGTTMVEIPRIETVIEVKSGSLTEFTPCPSTRLQHDSNSESYMTQQVLAINGEMNVNVDIVLTIAVEESAKKGAVLEVDAGEEHAESPSLDQGAVSEASWLAYLMSKKAEKGEARFTHFLRFLEEKTAKTSSLFQLVKASDSAENHNEAASDGSLARSWQKRFDMEMQLTWLDAADQSGDTAMQLAIREGLIDMLELLSTSGATLPEDCLFIAGEAESSEPACMMSLLAQPQLHLDALETRGEGGNTPLHVCAINGKLRMLECILDHKRDTVTPLELRAKIHKALQAQNNGGHNALHLAILHQHAPVVRALLRRVVDLGAQGIVEILESKTGIQGHTIVHLLCGAAEFAEIEAGGKKVDQEKEEKIRQQHNLKWVTHRSKDGIFEPEAFDGLCTLLAVKPPEAYKEHMRLGRTHAALLDEICDALSSSERDGDGDSGLNMCGSRYTRLLLTRSTEGTTPLHSAALSGRNHMLEKLLEMVRTSETGGQEKQLPYLRDSRGRTPLHASVEGGALTPVTRNGRVLYVVPGPEVNAEALIRAGVSIDDRDQDGFTAYDLAARSPNVAAHREAWVMARKVGYTGRWVLDLLHIYDPEAFGLVVSWIAQQDSDSSIDGWQRPSLMLRLTSKGARELVTKHQFSWSLHPLESVACDESLCCLPSIFPNLEAVHVRDGRNCGEPKDISDVGIEALAVGLEVQLKKLSIPWCKGISDRSLSALSEHCPWLEQLDVRGSGGSKGGSTTDEVTDKGLVSIARGCPVLCILELSHCTNLGDESLSALAEGCPKLEHVSLQGAPRITNHGLIGLFSLCPGLVSLNLAYCNITDELLLDMQKLQHLHILDISFCPNLGDKALSNLAAGSDSLKILRAWGSHFSDVAMQGYQDQRPFVSVEHGMLPTETLETPPGTEEDYDGQDFLPRISESVTPKGWERGSGILSQSPSQSSSIGTPSAEEKKTPVTFSTPSAAPPHSKEVEGANIGEPQADVSFLAY